MTRADFWPFPQACMLLRAVLYLSIIPQDCLSSLWLPQLLRPPRATLRAPIGTLVAGQSFTVLFSTVITGNYR